MAKSKAKILAIDEKIIDEVANEICDHYCKYPEIWNAESEGVELFESDICSGCPLTRLADREGAKE